MGGRGEGKRPCPSLPHCLYVCMCIKDSRSGSRDSATAVTGDYPPLSSVWRLSVGDLPGLALPRQSEIHRGHPRLWYYVIVVLSKHRFNGNEGGGAIGFVQKHTGCQEGFLFEESIG